MLQHVPASGVDQAKIDVTLKTVTNQSIPNQKVILKRTNGGTQFTELSAVTNENGVATFSFASTTEDTITFSVYYKTDSEEIELKTGVTVKFINHIPIYTAEDLIEKFLQPTEYEFLYASEYGYYTLEADIDCSHLPEVDRSFTFNGTFDGRGHTITGLRSKGHGGAYHGFIGQLSGSGFVKNLHLRDVQIKGAMRFGGLVGRNYGQILNSSVTGQLLYNVDGQWPTMQYIGGIAGVNLGHIVDTYADVTFPHGGLDKGGLVGSNSGSIDRSYVDNGNNLVGVGNGSINRSYEIYADGSGGVVNYPNGAVAKSQVEMKQTETYQAWPYFSEEWILHEGETYPLRRHYFSGLEQIKSEHLTIEGNKSLELPNRGWFTSKYFDGQIFDVTQFVEYSTSSSNFTVIKESGTWKLIGNSPANNEVLQASFAGKTFTIPVTVKEVKVSGVSLDKSAIELTAGGKAKSLIETVTPANANNKDVNCNDYARKRQQ